MLYNMYNIHNLLFRKKQSQCKGRVQKKCKTAKRKCLWANGSKRSFCRKRKSLKRR